MPLRKPSVTSGNGSGALTPQSLGVWGADHPSLSEFLCTSHWADGSLKGLGTLMVFQEGGAWKVCFSLRQAGLVGFVSVDSPETAYAEAERALADGTIDWRASAGGRRGGPPGKG